MSTRYAIFVTDFEEANPANTLWFKPSEVNPDWHDTEPSLDFAIKAARYYRNMFGLHTKREPVA